MSVDTTLYIDTNDNKDLHIVLDAIMKALKGMNFFTNKSPYSDKLCFNGEITFNLISKNGLSGFFVFLYR